jgi:hypothetical protein
MRGGVHLCSLCLQNHRPPQAIHLSDAAAAHRDGAETLNTSTVRFTSCPGRDGCATNLKRSQDQQLPASTLLDLIHKYDWLSEDDEECKQPWR